MKHATPATLDGIEPLLAAIRKVTGLRERQRGIFYRESIAYLHFHEDPAGLFADVKLKGAWKRLDVTSGRAKGRLLSAIRKVADSP
ncbi:MAG TPA: hypothetical protein VFS19_01660 [Planctomycetota bacterium]|nr:hypothetical protein [Planctomycetota bacterium]